MTAARSQLGQECKNRKEHARLEVEAHQKVLAWLRNNGGTEQEFKAMNQALGAWQQRFHLGGGHFRELP